MPPITIPCAPGLASETLESQTGCPILVEPLRQGWQSRHSLRLRPSSCSPAANPSVPTTSAPPIPRPPPTRKPAHLPSSFHRPTPPAAHGSLPRPPTACSAASGGRSIRTRSSTSSKIASPPTTRACARPVETYLAARDQVAVARAGLLSDALRRPVHCARQSSPHNRRWARPTARNQLQRPGPRRPGQLGARFLGPHPPHRRGRARKRPGQRRRHGQHRPQPPCRTGRGLLRAPRPRFPKPTPPSHRHRRSTSARL